MISDRGLVVKIFSALMTNSGVLILSRLTHRYLINTLIAIYRNFTPSLFEAILDTSGKSTSYREFSHEPISFEFVS